MSRWIPSRRSLHEQRIAKGEPHVLEFLAQVFPLPMHRQDEHTVALPEIELAQVSADKVDRLPMMPSIRIASRGAGALVPNLRFRLEDHAGHFLNPFHPGDRRLEEQQIARLEAELVERRLQPLAIAPHVDDARFAQAHERASPAIVFPTSGELPLITACIKNCRAIPPPINAASVSRRGSSFRPMKSKISDADRPHR